MNRARQFTITALCTLVSIVILTALMWWGMVNAWHSDHQNFMAHLLQVDEQISGEVNNQLSALDQQFPEGSCSPAAIRAMQIIEFHSKHLHQFGMVKDEQVHCLGSWGPLNPSLKRRPDDIPQSSYGPGYSRRAVVPMIPGAIRGARFHVGHYQAFLRPVYDPTSSNPWMNVGIYAYNDQDFQLVGGQHGISLSLATPTSSAVSRYYQGYWVIEECYNPTTCAITRINIRTYVAKEWKVTLVMAICFVLITLLISFFSHQQVRHYYSLTRQIRHGLNSAQIQCYYQPIIRIDTGTIEGCEVLCRWHSPEGELVMPEVFISEVENIQLTQQLTQVVVTKTFEELQGVGLLGELNVAINVFPDDVASGHIESLLAELLPEALFAKIIIEITEKQIDDLGRTAARIQRLRNKSVRVSIDDFGTGYSNLQHLKVLQVDCLKIDKSFVWGMEAQMLRASLVKHIVDMAQSLHLKTVAEGVEDIEQYAQLQELGVTFSQGYLHAKPLPLEEFVKVVRQWQPIVLRQTKSELPVHSL